MTGQSDTGAYRRRGTYRWRSIVRYRRGDPTDTEGVDGAAAGLPRHGLGCWRAFRCFEQLAEPGWQDLSEAPPTELDAALVQNGGQIQSVARAGRGHIQEAFRLFQSRRRSSSSTSVRYGQMATDGRPSPPSTITRTGDGCIPVPRPKSTRNTIGNSSPLAAWTVIRLTASKRLDNGIRDITG